MATIDTCGTVGENKDLVIFMRSYEPKVQCYNRHFADVGNQCRKTLFMMNFGSKPLRWMRHDEHQTQYEVLVPKRYIDRTSPMFFLLKPNLG